MARGLKPATECEADVVDLAHDGRGVARVEGKTVFVAGALPAERIRIRVHKRRRSWDEGELLEVLTASEDRVVPKCPHFGLCGGCSLQHMTPEAQILAKQRQLLDNLERIGKVTPQTVFAPLRGPEWGYRRRARLGVKFVHKKGRVLAGFRERDSAYLADLKRCEVLVPQFATLPQDLAELVDTLELREKIPQVEVAVGDQAAALVFRVMEPIGVTDLAKIAAFGTRQRAQIFLQTGGLDTIRPIEAGYPPLTTRIDHGAVTLQFGPADFVQVNREINNAMVDRAIELLAPTAQDTVLDLFCGLGNFTLPLARRSATVVGVEGDAGLVAKARANAAANGIANTEFHRDNLFEPGALGTWARARYSLVLIDPPRAGAAEIMERMPHWGPRRVLYISCHPGSLARDSGILAGQLGFKLIGAGVMDMFPHTTHVESLALFERDA